MFFFNSSHKYTKSNKKYLLVAFFQLITIMCQGKTHKPYNKNNNNNNNNRLLSGR
jgi:hypothetical protein